MTSLRSPEPRERTAAFVADVGAKFGKPFVESWLSARTCRFTDTSIFTLGFAADHLRHHCGAEIAAHGVSLILCPDMTEAVRSALDAKGKRA